MSDPQNLALQKTLAGYTFLVKVEVCSGGCIEEKAALGSASM